MIGWSKKLVKFRNSLTDMMQKGFMLYRLKRKCTDRQLPVVHHLCFWSMARNLVSDRTVEHFNELLNRASTVHQNSK